MYLKLEILKVLHENFTLRNMNALSLSLRVLQSLIFDQKHQLISRLYNFVLLSRSAYTFAYLSTYHSYCVITKHVIM